eukprot:7387937-Prymnesium_polylepis.1
MRSTKACGRGRMKGTVDPKPVLLRLVHVPEVAPVERHRTRTRGRNSRGAERLQPEPSLEEVDYGRLDVVRKLVVSHDALAFGGGGLQWSKQFVENDLRHLSRRHELSGPGG